MIRYFLREDSDVTTITNTNGEIVAQYHIFFGRTNLNIKKEELEKRGIELVIEG